MIDCKYCSQLIAVYLESCIIIVDYLPPVA
jgi:hypothetical protein